MKTPRRLAALALVLLAATVAGCARDEYPNGPLLGHASNDEVLSLPVRTDDPFVVVSFSGGGVRAAALGYTVLKELAKVRDRAGQPLTRDVRIVSSVSGGSVTAAWFGLYGNDAKFDELPGRLLTVDNMSALVMRGLNPVTWARLASPNFSRIDVLSEYFDERLFERHTYRDMFQRPGAPLVILNASDMASGTVFPFTRVQFDNLCSDLANLPIAVGVVASGAFPIALTPVTVKNWSSTPDCRVDPHPAWIDVPTRPATRYNDIERFKRALMAQRLRNVRRGAPDAGSHGDVEYQHLLDGGLSDNLGVNSVLNGLLAVEPGSEIAALNTSRIKSLVVVEVNARSDAPSALERSGETPGIFSMFGAVTSAPIDSTTRSVAGILDATLHTLRDSGKFESVYGITVDFDQFDPRDPQQVELRDKVKAVPTSWTIDNTELATVDEAARVLLAQHPCFIRLKADLAAAPPPEAAMRCPIR